MPREANRYDLMRQAGVDGTREDGSKPDRATDAFARGGELYVGRLLAGHVPPVSDKADAGYDVWVKGWCIGVHTSRYSVLRSHLIYHRRKHADTADLYVLVCTSPESGRHCFGGWAWAQELLEAPGKALDPRYGAAPSLHTSELHPLVELCNLIRSPRNVSAIRR